MTERRSLLVERKIFLAAYIMRKLYESKKLSGSFESRSIRCVTYPAKSKAITHLNAHKIAELYALKNGLKKSVSVRKLLDLIIHSFVFAEFLENDMTIEGFLISSDRTRQDSLWHIRMDDFIQLMRNVGMDYPSEIHLKFASL